MPPPLELSGRPAGISSVTTFPAVDATQVTFLWLTRDGPVSFDPARSSLAAFLCGVPAIMCCASQISLEIFMKQVSVMAFAFLTGLMAVPVHAQDHDKEKHAITIRIDGKDLSLPEAITSRIDKALEAIDTALASKELTSVNVDEIRNSVRKAIEESGGNGGFVYRNYSGERIEMGNPYSAREVREFKQTLGDGAVISPQSTRLLARDGEGRTRQELRQPDGSVPVFINDTVARIAIPHDGHQAQRSRNQRVSGAFGLHDERRQKVTPVMLRATRTR
jgi:hypothetical protein